VCRAHVCRRSTGIVGCRLAGRPLRWPPSALATLCVGHPLRWPPSALASLCVGLPLRWPPLRIGCPSPPRLPSAPVLPRPRPSRRAGYLLELVFPSVRPSLCTRPLSASVARCLLGLLPTRPAVPNSQRLRDPLPSPPATTVKRLRTDLTRRAEAKAPHTPTRANRPPLRCRRGRRHNAGPEEASMWDEIWDSRRLARTTVTPGQGRGPTLRWEQN
jgi:hypothetical protein